MREHIFQKLNQMENLEDRVLLKSILNNVFLELHDYSERMYGQLEERIHRELNYEENQYDIFTTLCKKVDVDPVHYFLYPMNLKDIEEDTYDFEDIGHNLHEEGEVKLFNIFLECDYLVYKEALREDIIYQGIITTEEHQYNGTFRLKPYTGYLGKVEELYEMFVKNNLPWKTMNNPYMTKFAEVILVEVDGLEPSEQILEIDIDFKEYAKYVHYHMVPLWNTQRLQLKSVGFPTPCEDEIYYEHVLSLKEVGAENGYLVDYQGIDIRKIVRREEELIITAREESSQIWNLVKIVSPKEDRTEYLEYPVISNSKRHSYLEAFTHKNNKNVKTMAELTRIINAFDIDGYLEFAGLDICDDSGDVEETYEVNYFIIDEIRDIDYKKKLILYFKSKKSNYFIIRDLLSFIVSEIQMYYPEYKCEGKLV